MRTQNRVTSPIEELQDRVINAGRSLGICPADALAVTPGAYFSVRNGITHFHSPELVNGIWERLYAMPC